MLKVKVVLIVIALTFVMTITLKIFSMLRKWNWLIKHKFVKLLKMAHTGNVFVPWEDVLNPNNSSIIGVEVVKKYFDNYRDEVLKNYNLGKINIFSDKKTLVILKFSSPRYTWRNRCGTSGFLFFDEKNKEQLEYFEICRN